MRAGHGLQDDDEDDDDEEEEEAVSFDQMNIPQIEFEVMLILLSIFLYSVPPLLFS